MTWVAKLPYELSRARGATWTQKASTVAVHVDGPRRAPHRMRARMAVALSAS